MRKVKLLRGLALAGKEMTGFRQEENHCGIQQPGQLSSYYYLLGFSKLLYSELLNLKGYIL